MQVLRPDTVEPFGPEPLEEPEPAPAFAPRPETDGPAYAMVLVEWHDAWFDQDQTDFEEFRSDYLVRTVGFLIDEGPHVVTVAHEVLPDGDGFRAVTHIPVAIIERIQRLLP